MATEHKNVVRGQAVKLAAESKVSVPTVKTILWFPDDDEVRLIEVDENTVTTVSGQVEPFYFDASPADDLPVPSGIAIIRPEERGRLTMPTGWGNWEDGQELDVER
ncbi:MAG: hypothetical protein V2B18_20300 [Pseudomonadota bacterium]